jgi:hypothetical protein
VAGVYPAAFAGSEAPDENGLIPAGKLDDAPLTMQLHRSAHGLLEAQPAQDCRTQEEDCRNLASTDFTTEFSLW